jgi:RHS repeat-associated protein
MRQKILDLLHKSQKNILGSLLFTVYSLFSNAQTLSTDKNAVIEYRARISTTDPNALHSPTSAVINVQYFDGLGRPLQTVGYGQSPTQKDIVSGAVQYDNYGRQVRSYLPTPTTVSAGGYQNNVAGLGQSFYGDNHAFEAVDAFDNSPLNRVKRSYGAGQAWKTAGKYKAVYYETAGTDVRLYTLEASGTILFSGYYPPNSLFKTRFIDEQGHSTIEIKDIDGRLVEKHTEETSGGTSGFLITHYLYDGSDRIRAVIQPNGYAQGTHFYYNDSNYQNAIFAYEYNDGGNLARKHIPNGGWTSYVYDRGDRPVLEQNAQQATQGKWSFTKYDVFGRTIIEGELTNYNDRSTLQNWFDNNVTTPYETWNGAGYSSQSFPIGYNATDEKKWFFYDGYNWMSGTLAFNASLAYNPSSYWSNASGLPTGSWSRDPQNTALVYHTVYHYDNKGRMLQTYQVHQKGGNQPWLNPIITNYEYNFAGEVTKEKTIYKIDGQADTEALTWNEYDHVGRLLKIYHGINSSTPTEIVRLNYDEIGRLSQKKILPNGTYLYSGIPDYINRPPNPNVGIDDVAKKAICLLPGTDISNTYSVTIDPNANSGTPISGLQTIQYAYHIRGGLHGINLDASGNAVPNVGEGDLFSYKLDYETAGQWDGNIGKQTWRNDTESQRSYLYTYDPAKRLKSATYQGVGTENFSIPNMSYDKNGNITNLQRWGKIGSDFGLLDNLTYYRQGNQLTSITDTQPSTTSDEFIQRGGGYTYYPDGSLKSDANEQIANIVYDTYLKQQKEVYLTDGRKLLHFYDGGGTLLKTVYYSAQNTVLETWEFLPHGMVYKNGVPYQLITPEGRAVWNGTSWTYEFDYKDHLGNTRVSFKEASGVLVKTAETAFDPYGVRLNGIGAVNSFQNRWEMQGHEKESTFGLNRVDFGARTLNPTTGVWDRVDAMSEKYFGFSPYNYTLNNPINAIDPDGNDIEYLQDRTRYSGDDAANLLRNLQNGGGGGGKQGSSYGGGGCGGSGQPPCPDKKTGDMVTDIKSSLEYGWNVATWTLKETLKEIDQTQFLGGGNELLEGNYLKGAALLMISTGKAPGGKVIAKNVKKMLPDDIGLFLKAGEDWHKGSAKKDFLKQFKKDLKGDTNADFYFDKDTRDVFLRSNKSGNWINTGQKFDK